MTRSSIGLGLTISAALFLAPACSTNMTWKPLKDRADERTSTGGHNLALLAHIYQYESGGRTGTVKTIRELAGTAEEDRVSSDTALNDQCMGAFVENYQNGKFNRDSRDRFRCVMKGALAWHAKHHGDNAVGTPLDIMLYFNGGLNTKEAVLETAFQSHEHIKADGYYPIYMPWPTGPFDTYVEDWLNVRAGRYTPASKWTTLGSIPARPFYDLLLGVASTPGAWSTSVIEFTRTSLFREESGFDVLKDESLVPKPPEPGKPALIVADKNLSFADTVDDRENKNLLSAATDQAIYLSLFPSRLLTAPAIGPGFALWRNMVRRSRTAFRDKDEFPPENDVSIGDRSKIDCGESYEDDRHERQKCHPRGSGAFGQFFHWLDACRNRADDCPLSENEQKKLGKLRLTLIGHSMGVIVINEAVGAFPDLPYRDIVYMAGAATVRETANALSPVLVDNRGCTRFFNLMLHPLNDSLERTARGVLISGSLLSYIDEYLENPKTMPDRTVGQWRNLRQTRHLFPPEARQWSLYRIFDRFAKPATTLENGKQTFDWNPTTHGSFNDKNMPFWRESFRKPDGVTFGDPIFDETMEACAWEQQPENNS